MEKKRYIKIPRHKNENVGVPTGLLNANRDEIISGDYIHLKGTQVAGPVLWNRHYECFGICEGCWYLDKDPLNAECYGKFTAIPTDQGMRMELLPITPDMLPSIWGWNDLQ